MTKLNISLPFFCLLLFSISGGLVKFAHGQVAGQASWCVAKTSTPDDILQLNINYVCSNLKDCSIIQAGGACYEPKDVRNQASVVMNLFYQKSGRKDWQCAFKSSTTGEDTGVVTISDPSYGGCKYAFGA